MNIEYFHIRKGLLLNKIIFLLCGLSIFLIDRPVSLVHLVDHDTSLLSNFKSLLSLGFLYRSMSLLSANRVLRNRNGLWFCYYANRFFYRLPDSLTVYLYWVLESKYKELHSIKNVGFHAFIFHCKILYHFNLMLNCTTPCLPIYQSEL